ncbi:hypothetical protein DFJ66_1126 [Saccharothrix variisporea]|uniref:Uncharacterized protein n=1 Tax=Saccharothrix variisporea TaxID=543527 RepID=A0A495X240_9PSEU|nr:hypothetical protein DFJ66_1126 [Saccharothrix variisporea]
MRASRDPAPEYTRLAVDFPARIRRRISIFYLCELRYSSLRVAFCDIRVLSRKPRNICRESAISLVRSAVVAAQVVEPIPCTDGFRLREK